MSETKTVTERERWKRRQAGEAVQQDLDARGCNKHDVLMCACKPFGGIHAWEPGEWCGDRVNPCEIVVDGPWTAVVEE